MGDNTTATLNQSNNARSPLEASPSTFASLSLSPTNINTTDHHVHDIIIIGGGMSGVTIARDVASAGYTSLILERTQHIGGVWSQNDYEGLHLHGLAHCYRCASLAPEWQKQRRRAGQISLNDRETHYRPCRNEIINYITEMASHPNITVWCGMEYIDHSFRNQTEVDDSHLREHQFEVKVQNNNNSEEFISCFADAVIFATGTNEMATGAPNLPIDPSKISNGATLIHSSELAQKQDIFNCGDIENLYVIGSSKASIDILHHFLQTEQNIEEEEEKEEDGFCNDDLNGEDNIKRGPNIIWCHRGHCLFIIREHLEGWATSPNLPLRYIRYFLFVTVYWLVQCQWFKLVQFFALLSGVCARVGTPLTDIPMRGGIESKHVLNKVRTRYKANQRILVSKGKKNGVDSRSSMVVNDDGVLELSCADGSTIRVGSRDVVCFCTGQSQLSNESFYSSLLDPLRNKDGVFTVQVYCMVAPVNAILTALWVIQYLDGLRNEEDVSTSPSYNTAYSRGEIACKCQHILETVENFHNRHPWAVTMSYFATSMGSLSRIATPGIVGDLSFDYRWRHHEWFGVDLDIRSKLAPLCSSIRMHERGRWYEKQKARKYDRIIELPQIV